MNPRDLTGLEQFFGAQDQESPNWLDRVGKTGRLGLNENFNAVDTWPRNEAVFNSSFYIPNPNMMGCIVNV